MATLTVRKDGSGTHSTIQAAIYDAVTGDIVDVGPGTWNENVDLYKGITLKGDGKASTIVVGSIKTNVVKSGTWALASTTLNFPSGTEGFEKGRVITGTGIPTNARIASVSANSVTISAPTTAARTSLTNATMQHQNDATMRVRGSGAIIFGIKFSGFDHPNPSVEYAAVYFRNTGLGTNYAQNFEMYDCEIEANGEYALLADFGAAVGNGTVRNCHITGKTFVGSNPASGNQFTVWNVPRQLVAFQSVNLPIVFKDNLVEGVTGGLTIGGTPSYNTAVTVDAPGSTVTGNTIRGDHGYGYALRCRGANTVTENNVNEPTAGENAGYLIWTPSGNVSGLTVGNNTSVLNLLVTVAQAVAGGNVSLSFNKSMLKGISSVSSDAYFSNEANWRMVSLIYKNDAGAKRIFSGFKSFEEIRQFVLRQNMASGEKYMVHKVIISDTSRQLKTVKRSEMTSAAAMDIILK
jgi:hypothetical protein